LPPPKNLSLFIQTIKVRGVAKGIIHVEKVRVHTIPLLEELVFLAQLDLELELELELELDLELQQLEEIIDDIQVKDEDEEDNSTNMGLKFI
jgi:hypothetical protein